MQRSDGIDEVLCASCVLKTTNPQMLDENQPNNRKYEQQHMVNGKWARVHEREHMGVGKSICVRAYGSGNMGQGM